MQRNRPGLTNIETSNNLIGNTMPLSAGYPPHTTTSYNGGQGAPTLSLQNNSGNFYNQSQKLHIESESVRSSYNPLRISKGGVNFMQSMTPDASSTTQGVFGQNLNQASGNNNFGNQHFQHQHRYQQGAMQNQNQQHNNHQQNNNSNSVTSYEQQFSRQFGNASSSLNKEQNKSENYSNTQQILLNTSSGNSNARNNSQKQQNKVTGKQGDNLQNSLNFSRNFQQNTSTVNSNNNSNHFQNINSQGNTLNSNINKLSIDTSGETRPYSANNFTSYSATNSSAPMFGTKHSLISSLNGLMTTKFNEKPSLEFQNNHTQMQHQPQQQQPSSSTNIPTLNTSYQRHNLANQQFAAHGSENNQQGGYNQNNNHLSNNLQRNSNNNGNNQQQNVRDESPSIKAKLNNYIQTNGMNGQQQQVSQSQGNNSFMNGQNSNNGFKKQVGASINLKEGFASYKQQEEQKRLSKSIQGHEIQRVIQSQQNQQFNQQQPSQPYIQQQQLQNQQKANQNNENINPLSQQHQQTQGNQMKKQAPLSNQSQAQTNSNQTSIQQQNQAAMDQKQILKAQLTQNVNEPLIGKSEPLPNHEPTKCSFKRNGIVKAYAANTNQGLVRNYNEDRVSIILNIMKPASRANEQWPKCSFFGVYDGHGGVNCADFLRDNLHQFVIKESSFPWNPKEALRNGFAAAEKAFLELAQAQEDQIDRSGSCAIVILIVGDTCYVANVGDSRAVLSGESGQKVYTLSRDHKPTDELEQKRIIQGGGKIYQTHATQVKQGTGDQKAQTQLVVGPLRVFPGRLSVSRTFGDIEAKLEKLGGNPNVVISEPEIKSFKITDDHDFIVLASDGVFDKMTSKEVIQSVWNNEEASENIHKQCSVAVESILRDSLNKRSLDNVTVVMIAFNNYKIKLFGNQEKKNKPVLEERKNFQQPALNSADYASHGNKLEYSSVLNQGNKTATASASQHYNGDFNKFSDKDFRKSLNITPSNRSAAGELQLRKKFKENQIYSNNENYSYMNSSANNGNNNFNNNQNHQPLSNNSSQINNANSGNQIHAQFNKLRLLDQKISEISNKVNQFSSFDRKINSNNR